MDRAVIFQRHSQGQAVAWEAAGCCVAAAAVAFAGFGAAAAAAGFAAAALGLLPARS